VKKLTTYSLKFVLTSMYVVIPLFLYFIGWFVMKVIEVKENQNNKKLDKILFDCFPSLKQNTFFKALRKKDIRINDVRVSENVLVHTGDNIKVFICDELLESSPSFSVVYEDDFILVVDKPAQLEVTDSENSLTSLLQKQYSFIKPCHRIDRNTTGLVLFAKTPEALDILLAKFKQKEIEFRGHSIECRINAENPNKNFMPCPRKNRGNKLTRRKWNSNRHCNI